MALGVRLEAGEPGVEGLRPLEHRQVLRQPFHGELEVLVFQKAKVKRGLRALE